jgi:DNA-binding transcriptional LysR family regulator
MMTDLNLVRLFDVLMTERNLRRAGLILGRTQPAISNALKRLRAHYGDPLFLKTAQGVAPTPKAEALWAEIAPALETLRRVSDPAHFDPAEARGSLAIAATDYEATLLAARLGRLMAREAPSIALVFKPGGGGGAAQRLLDAGEAAFAVGYLPQRTSAIRAAPLFDDQMMLVMDPANPLAHGPITLEAFAEARHLLVSPAGETEGFVDAALRERGLTRKIALVVNQFHVAPAAILGSDLVGLVSARVLNASPLAAGLVRRAPPLPVFTLQVSLYWHRRSEADPRHAWARALISRAAAGI